MSIVEIGHLLALLAFGCIPLAAYRFIRRRSRVTAALFAAAILARVTLGLALFWVSFLELPFAEGLQAGGGFWELAVDARQYYEFAEGAIGRGELTYEPLAPSPFYVWVLTLWMSLVGVSPAAAMLLNLCLYATLMTGVVWLWRPADDWRRDLPCIGFVAAYSFFPVILIHSTQPLKDELFNVVLAVACIGVLTLRRLIYRHDHARVYRWIALGAVALAIATFGAAGIRWYYGFMMWCAAALLFAIFTFWGRTIKLPEYAATSILVLAVAWLGFWAGSGRFYFRAADMTSVAQLSNITQLARVGFLTSGGATNIVIPLRDDLAAGKERYDELLRMQRAFRGIDEIAAAEQRYIDAHALPEAPGGGPDGPAPAAAPDEKPAIDPATRGLPITVPEQVFTIASGLAVLFVPITVLQSLAGIELQGGRGLLSIVDLDTVVFDAANLFVLAVLWKRRRMIGDRLPFVVYGLILSAVTAVLLGYVVTNFGTLWRLRSLVAVPLWILVLAVSRAPESPRGAAAMREQAVVG